MEIRPRSPASGRAHRGGGPPGTGRSAPTQALLDASADADLLIVGSRGHGGFADALLSSVSQHCVHHARCPVVVMRGEPAARAANGRASADAT